MALRIDGLQYANLSEPIFRQRREAGMDALHVTITDPETFRETVQVIEAWNRHFERHGDLVMQGSPPIARPAAGGWRFGRPLWQVGTQGAGQNAAIALWPLPMTCRT